MKVVQGVLLVLHLLGVVALLFGLLVQLRHPEKRVTGPVRDGIGTTFLAGLVIDGYAAVRATLVPLDGREKSVLWMTISDAGRKAIAE